MRTIIICIMVCLALSTASANDFQTIMIDSKTASNAAPLNGVPHYDWYYGCSPTSGAMIIGYWDAKPGFENLFYGDASMESQATRDLIASAAHRTTGAENGYTYGDWHNSPSNPNHQNNPDCLADFMHTIDGGSYSDNIAQGLVDYIAWDKPATPINESYQASAAVVDDTFWQGGTFSYQLLKDEIDADRPLILNLFTYHSPENSWFGHSIVCYGYADTMFSVYSPSLGHNITVPGLAVDDTWNNGVSYTQWIYDSDNDNAADSWFSSVIDAGGTEWWPLLTLDNTGGISYTNYWDWMLSDVITLNIQVPEPAAITILALGFIFIRRK